MKYTQLILFLFVSITILLSACSTTPVGDVVAEPESVEQDLAELQTPTSDCPYGLHDDAYPGACGQYQDGDGNHICDLSE